MKENTASKVPVEQFFSHLARDEHGIWLADVADTSISYPVDGHDACLGVEDGSFWFRHRNDCIAALVSRYPPPGFVLDIGGGNGFVARRLLDEGYPCVLLEPGLPGTRNARLVRHLPWVVCASLEHARLPAASVPAVGLFDVIEHVADDRKFIGGVADLLSPHGLLYLTVPRHAWLWSAADDLAGHQRRYDARALQELLEPRFEILYLGGFFAALLPAIALLRALPYRAGRGRRKGLLDSSTEHGSGRGVAARTITRLLAPEVDAIARGRHLPFGASLILAARRRM